MYKKIRTGIIGSGFVGLIRKVLQGMAEGSFSKPS
jgi:hypothetical protein